jgi:hypothetical protein
VPTRSAGGGGGSGLGPRGGGAGGEARRGPTLPLQLVLRSGGVVGEGPEAEDVRGCGDRRDEAPGAPRG